MNTSHSSSTPRLGTFSDIYLPRLFWILLLVLAVSAIFAPTAFASTEKSCKKQHTCGGQGNSQGNMGNSNKGNGNDAVIRCTLLVPPNPLSAQGLATPYQLFGPDATNTQGNENDTSGQKNGCHEANTNQAAFVEATILDPQTGKVFVYDPVVVDKGTTPAVAPIVPQLPNGSIVGIDFGFNGTVLTLTDDGNGGLSQGNCTFGIPGSPFGQVAYCNNANFFAAANQAIQGGLLTPPALATARDGMTCPTTSDFSVVDMDQTDNTFTSYLITHDGKIAQNTSANAGLLNQDAKILLNPSDTTLLDKFIDPAIGCQPWLVPDLADTNGGMITSLDLSALQAAAHQPQPIALAPSRHPMTLINMQTPNLEKLNLFRVNVDQPQVQALDQANTSAYCQNLFPGAAQVTPLPTATTVPLPVQTPVLVQNGMSGLQRIALDKEFTINAPSLVPMMANNLFTFLANRFRVTYSNAGLACVQALHLQNPVQVTMNDNQVVVDARINLTPVPLDGQGQNNGTSDGGNQCSTQQQSKTDNQSQSSTQNGSSSGCPTQQETQQQGASDNGDWWTKWLKWV